MSELHKVEFAQTILEDGTVALVKATPEEYTEVSTFKAPGSGERPSWAHPVVLDGRLYLRENDVILCYDVRAKALALEAKKQPVASLKHRILPLAAGEQKRQ